MSQVDRSRILDAQSCPRKRYWAYEFNGQGLQRLSKSLPLVLGGALHEGLAMLVEGKPIDSAVLRSQLELSNAFEARGIALEDNAQAEYAMFEQGALAEGLLRAWELYEGERFRRDFEVLEVESEGRAELVEGIELMYRPDAVVRERMTGDVYVLSWKSCSMFSQMTMNQAATDMQSMSEAFGVEQKLGLKVEGILYKFLVKGRRAMNDYAGGYRQDSPLIYGWVREGPTPDENEYAWKYKWQTEEINPKTGKPVGTTLGKGFHSFPVWKDYSGGVKAWVAALAAQEITPRHINALEGVFPQSMPVSRRADEIESWRRQTVAAEKRIQEAAALMDYEVTENGSAQFVETLDETFPQSTQRCFDYMSRCQFYECCFTPAVKGDPLGSGLYQLRVPNHPSEKGSSDGE